MSLKAKAISGIKWTTLSTIIITILQFIQLIILARLLDPSAFGILAIVMIVIGFSKAFLDMGISNAIIQKQEITHNQLSTLYWINVLAGFTVFVIISLAAPFIAEFYKEPELKSLIFIVSLTFVIQPFGQQFMILWKKEMRFKEMAKIDVTNTSVSVIISVYLAYKGYGVYALAYGTLSGTISQTIQFMYLGLKEHKPSFVFKINDTKEFLSFGAFQMGEKSINYISANIDKILIGKFIGMEALGFYNLAWKLVLIPLTKINPIVNKVAFPLYAKVQKDKQTLSHYYTKSLSSLFLVVVPILVFLFYYSQEIVFIAYGEGWELTATLLKILVVIGLFKAIGNPAGALLLAIGRADVSFWWNLVWAFLVSMVLYTTMIISKNMEFIAYSLLGLSLLTSYIYHKMIQKFSGVLYKKIVINFIKVLVVTLIIGLISLTVIILINRSHHTLRFLTGTSIYLTLYAVYLKKYEMKIINLFLKKR